jgi:hypothetical protein
MNLLQRFAFGVAIALLEALSIILAAGVVLGYSFASWTKAESAVVGIVATLASIAVAHAVVFRVPRRPDRRASDTTSLRVFEGTAAP